MSENFLPGNSPKKIRIIIFEKILCNESHFAPYHFIKFTFNRL